MNLQQKNKPAVAAPAAATAENDLTDEEEQKQFEVAELTARLEKI